MEGIAIRPKIGFAASSGEQHPGQFLSTLAECGIVSDEPISTSEETFSVRDILSQAESDYRTGDSVEFVAIAFVSYLPPQRGFRNGLNEFVTFDTLMRSLTDSVPGEGSCHGAHVCYAIAAMLNINQKVPILSESTTQCGEDYLAHIAKLLTATQHSDGAWRIDWSEEKRCRAPVAASPTWGDAILVTAHHLEWLAIAPRHLLAPHHIQRAIQFLAREIGVTTQEEILRSYCPWSHAARSLLLWHTIIGRETAIAAMSK